MTETQIEILLVDDNEQDIELTLRALRRENLINRIHVARDGEEALEYLFSEQFSSEHMNDHVPRLVLLDLKLPKVDGIDVLRQLKAHPLTHNIPVVILTSSREERDLVQSYGSGANSYIQKPVDFEQFRDTVKSAGLYWLLINQSPPPACAA